MTLPIELWALLGCGVILIFSIQAQAFHMIARHGIGFWLSARDKPKDGVMAGRLDRNARNNLEGLAMFAPLVVFAVVAGISNDWTRISAEIYLATRLIFPFTYVSGVQPYRTILWGIGLGTLFTFFYGLMVGVGTV